MKMKNYLKTNLLTRIGWGLSFLWLIFVGILLCTHKFPEDLNSIGDFVAGMASPLAFLWVVIGYYQSQEALKLQAKELSQSSEALVHQVEEMKKTADIQQQHLDEMRQQYIDMKQKDEINKQPFLELEFVNLYTYTKKNKQYYGITVSIECMSNFGRNLYLTIPIDNVLNLDLENPLINYMKKDDVLRVKILTEIDEAFKLNNKELRVIYRDINHKFVHQVFKIFTSSGNCYDFIFERFEIK